MYLLYSVLFVGLLGIGLPYFAYRSLRAGSYGASLKERLGFIAVNPKAEPSIWIHAVSVGEVIAAQTLLPLLQEALPGRRIALSVTTVTGRRVAEERLKDADDIFFCPFDVGFLVRRALRKVKPMALLVVETEIWPHLFREAKRAGAVTLLVNGRISDRSFPRYRRIRPFLRRYLREVDSFCMQNELYARRIVDLGAPTDRVRVTGSLKFDAHSEKRAGTRVRLLPAERKILIAGSTLDPEEKILLAIFERLRHEVPELLLVLAPRHPRRFEEAFALARERNLEVERRSEIETPPARADVVILDTLGELASLYAEGDCVFVGGSLARWGGHNIIEPASKGKPVTFGPHMENFRDIAREFVSAGAAIQVRDERELEARVRDLLIHPDRGRELGERARQVVERNRGASRRTVAALQELLA